MQMPAQSPHKLFSKLAMLILLKHTHLQRVLLDLSHIWTLFCTIFFTVLCKIKRVSFLPPNEVCYETAAVQMAHTSATR